MFVCVIIITHVLRLYYTIFYQEPRSEPHQRGHLGGEQKHRFDVARKVRTFFPTTKTAPVLVCLCLAFPYFLYHFPFFWFLFWCSCFLFLYLSSVLRKDLLILRAFLWEFADEYDGVDQFCPFNQTNFSRNSRIRFQLQGSWEWLEVKKLQHNFQKEVLGYNNDCGCQFLLWVFIKLEVYLILARWMNFNDSTLAETWRSLIRF